MKCCWQNNMSGAVLNFQHSSSLSLNRRACCRPSFRRTPDSDSPPALRVHSVSAAQEDMNRPGRTGREAGWQVTVILKAQAVSYTTTHQRWCNGFEIHDRRWRKKRKKEENESGQWHLGVSMIKKRKTLYNHSGFLKNCYIFIFKPSKSNSICPSHFKKKVFKYYLW